jgi:hypothetical protein
MKIAILFRGPVRPNINSVTQKIQFFMDQFSGFPAKIHTYLACYRYWHHHRAIDLISSDWFNNVIMLTEPGAEQIRQCTDLHQIRNGMPIHSPYKMYTLSKIALDTVVQSDDYDYIIHTRSDLWMRMDPLQEWFVPDTYVAPHVTGDPWMCDQFGVAPADIMHKAWDYGTKENLDHLFRSAAIPETVLELMMAKHDIKVKKGPYSQWHLDPMRNTA